MAKLVDVRLNATRWRGRLRLMTSRRARARRALTMELAGLVVAKALSIAPRDTQRYVAALAQAGNKAGVGRFPVASIRAGRWALQLKKKLEKQASFWDFVVREYEQEGRTTEKYYSKAKKKLARAQQELAKFDDSAIVVNAFGTSGALITVRNKIYGGTGRTITLGDKTIVQLHNLEAHASLVERRYAVMKRAMATVKGLGLWGKGQKYVAELAGLPSRSIRRGRVRR